MFDVSLGTEHLQNLESDMHVFEEIHLLSDFKMSLNQVVAHL